MTFEAGTKVRYKAQDNSLSALNGIEGVVISEQGDNTTVIKVIKGSDAGTHERIIGKAESFSTSNLVSVDEPAEFKVGDRVEVNDPGTTHHGLVGIITEVGGFYLGTIKADVDEDCAAFKELHKWNENLDGEDWYLKTSTLELVEEEKLKEGGEISYEQVERGQRIRVSYESKGVIHSREGIVGKVSNNRTYAQQKENWTINVLDDERERYNDTGQRLNWGSDKQKETIVLLENVPEVDAVLERLLESKGGTVVRVFGHEFLVREPFSDCWKNPSDERVYTSESVRRFAGDKIVFFVEDMGGN